jgi:cyclopropane-fatty-acyl-phospholipid synthase
MDLFMRSGVLSKLNSFSNARIDLCEMTESGGPLVTHLGGHGDQVLYRAQVTVKNPRFYSRLALGGSLGACESYLDGDWECDDLPSLVRIFCANSELLESLDRGVGRIFQPVLRFLHRLRDNTLDGASRNIQAHYDIGNDFFGLFLDDTWMYSCGIFSDENSTLQEASIAKNDRICKKLGLKPGDHLLEIGTGWGGFAIHAAQNYGCKVTTTTISPAQYELAQKRIKEAGLQDQIQLLLKDYRELAGKYDKIVSIEMIEAVGLDRQDEYFAKCSQLLKPEGIMGLQAIIIRDHLYENARRTVDFIQRHIFPGSGIPSVASMTDSMARKTDMRVSHLEDLTPHYARTLHEWSTRLKANQHLVTMSGYPEQLNRLWQFYFAYCEGGFLERRIGCVQLILTKPGDRTSPVMGELRK